MKKTLLVLVALLCILAIAACGANVAQNTNFDEIPDNQGAFDRAAGGNYDLLSNDGEDVTENTPATVADEPTAYQLGDVNKDGWVTGYDVLMVFRNVYNPELYPIIDITLADFDADGKITNKDLLAICKIAILNDTAYTEGLEFTLNAAGTEYSVTDYTGTATDVVIPAQYEWLPVTSIGNAAFSDCKSLTSITIPDSVTSIGNTAFTFCTSLTSITIPDSVTSIGQWAFSDCESLTSITIPDSVTSIGDHAFSYCTSLTSITIPDSVTSIGGYVFSNCSSLTTITIPDSVTSIGNYAFRGCTSLTNIKIPDSVSNIGMNAFQNCTSLTSITIPGGVKTIEEYTFYYCTSLKSIDIPDSVTSIGERAFYNCTSLTSITIGNSVTSIGDLAFSDCTSLTSITIPDSVTSIGVRAFYGCPRLTTIMFNGTKAKWNAISKGYYWDDNTDDYTIYCTDGEITKS